MPHATQQTLTTIVGVCQWCLSPGGRHTTKRLPRIRIPCLPDFAICVRRHGASDIALVLVSVFSMSGAMPSHVSTTTAHIVRVKASNCRALEPSLGNMGMVSWLLHDAEVAQDHPRELWISLWLVWGRFLCAKPSVGRRRRAVVAACFAAVRKVLGPSVCGSCWRLRLMALRALRSASHLHRRTAQTRLPRRALLRSSDGVESIHAQQAIFSERHGG